MATPHPSKLRGALNRSLPAKPGALVRAARANGDSNVSSCIIAIIVYNPYVL